MILKHLVKCIVVKYGIVIKNANRMDPHMNLESSGNEMAEVYNETEYPLSIVQDDAKRARDDSLIFLPYIVFIAFQT